MAHSFSITVDHGDIPAIVDRVQAVITGGGGHFSGDAEKGMFQGRSPLGAIRGEYCALSERELRITIKDKPFVVPYSMIEGEIRKYFG